MKSLLFFSNPFGYGPTATMIAVLRHFTKIKDIQICVIAHGLCTEIINNNSNITIIDINQRDVTEIQTLIKQYKNPYVISSLNRFAILASKALNVPSCFIDTLTYLWDKIPDDYLKADMYYANNFPTVLDKMAGHDNTIPTPLIIDINKDLMHNDYNRHGIILQLGGLKSPLTDTPPKKYLDLIAFALNNTNQNMTVTGGADGLKYLQTQVTASNIKFVTLAKDEFLQLLSASELCVSTPGLNTTLESIFLQTPINFIMPTNLSQWVNHNIFKQLNTGGADITWENIIGKKLNINGLPEYDAIIQINQIAEGIQHTPSLMNKFVEMFNHTISQPPCIKRQCRLLKKYGTNGTEFIFNDICKRWGIC